MLTLEFKLKGKESQLQALNEAIRTAQFVRNKALQFWLDNPKAKGYDLNKYCAVLAKEFDWVSKLNSQARQASAERTWAAIAQFFSNCRKKIAGKKGFPKFQKNNRSVEYKLYGWRLDENRKYITFTDGFKAGSFKLVGSRDLHFYQINQIKRVRIVRRADGYYCQFCIDVERSIQCSLTKQVIGIDLGLTHFYTDSNGDTADNPRFLRKSEKALKRLQRRQCKKKLGSNNRKKATNRFGRKHLKVSRQRKDFAVKLARCVVMSSDLVVYEQLQVQNMTKNRRFAKSISNAGWGQFTLWLQYFGRVYDKKVIAVSPHNTTQNCSACGKTVRKKLIDRKHICSCGVVLDRDHNAALNILKRGMSTAGQTGINAWGENNLYSNVVTNIGQVGSRSQEFSCDIAWEVSR